MVRPGRRNGPFQPNQETSQVGRAVPHGKGSAVASTHAKRRGGKQNYIYFDDSHGFLSNILYADPNWERHSNFLVYELLDFLVLRRKQNSVIGSQGYFPVWEIVDHTTRMGFAPEDAHRALEYLLRRGLVTADHLGKTHLSEEDFLRAHASGFVHARLLLENIHYVAGIAPSLYLNDRNVARQIGRLAIVNLRNPLILRTARFGRFSALLWSERGA